MENKNNKAGSVKADVVAGITSGIGADFVRSKDGKDYNFKFTLASLPWENDAFRMKMCQAAGGAIAWRSSASLKVLPENGGIVDVETFAKAVFALDFRGDEKPNKDDFANAKPILNSIETGMYTAEEAAAFIKADPKYGWDVDPTPEGFAKHEMLKRLKLKSSKATTVALNTL